MDPTISLIGGTALLVYSMDVLCENIQHIAGSRFRVWINLFAGNRFLAIILGLVLSILMSSSGAVTVMLVGLANARLLSLDQIFAVTLGASVGTTVIVQIVAFNLTNYAFLIITTGVIITVFAKTEYFSYISRILIFLGLMFFSMRLIMDAGIQLETNPFFQYTIDYFKTRPFASLCVAVVMTALFHSSAATLAFIMSLTHARNSSLSEAIPWILGANLGTTSTAILASIKGGILGKQTAVANLLCKVSGVALVYPFSDKLSELGPLLTGDVIRQIAHIHTLFNIALAVFFFPLISVGVKITRWFVPQKEQTGPFHYDYLDQRSLSTPELALAQAQREILRVSDLVENMVSRCLEPFKFSTSDDVKFIREKDQVVDFLNRGIKYYLTRLSQKEMNSEQVQREFELLWRINDLEAIGDIVDKNILDLARKFHRKGYTFSREGWSEITEFQQKVLEVLRLSNAYFASKSPELKASLELRHSEVKEMVLDLGERHIQRLHRGIKETLDTTSVHLDLLGNLQRIEHLSFQWVERTLS